MIICMATVETQTYYLMQAYLRGRVQLALQAIIIVQNNIHHGSKVFTTGQDRVNSEHYVIKCVSGT